MYLSTLLGRSVLSHAARGGLGSAGSRPSTRRAGSRALAGVAALVFAAAGAQAQYSANFEPPLSGSASGVSINGQDGWFTPAVAGSIDGLVMSYAGNVLGLPVNPTGGDQFLGERSSGGTAFARTQRIDVTYPTTAVLCYDVAGGFNGVAPTAQNLGSFSLQPEPNSAAPALKSYIQLNQWVDVANPTAWNAGYLPYDAAGVQFPQPAAVPGPEWQNLELYHWYRLCTTVDFTLNQITSTSITDLNTGVTTTVEPVGWYVGGGANSTLAMPTGLRFFAGGNDGNIMGWDNFTAEAPTGCGSPCIGDFNCDGGIDGSDVEAFFLTWSAGDPAGDVNQDGGVDGGDVEFFFVRWEAGC